MIKRFNITKLLLIVFIAQLLSCSAVYRLEKQDLEKYNSRMIVESSDRPDGQALKFSDTDKYSFIILPQNSNLDFGKNDFSISLWINSISENTQMVIQKGGLRGALDPQYWLRLNDKLGNIVFLLGNGDRNNPYIEYNEKNVCDGLWHHIVVVRQNIKLKMYLDGEQVGEQRQYSDREPSKLILENTSNNQSVKIGIQIYDKYVNKFEGLMDDIYFYKKALTEKEIKKIYENQK